MPTKYIPLPEVTKKMLDNLEDGASIYVTLSGKDYHTDNLADSVMKLACYPEGDNSGERVYQGYYTRVGNGIILVATGYVK